MVRHRQHQWAWIPSIKHPGNGGFGCLADIARQQQPSALPLDQHHAGLIVAFGALRVLHRRTQDANDNTVEIPALTIPAGSQCNVTARSFATEYFSVRPLRQHRWHSAGMVVVGMADDCYIQAFQTQSMQTRQHRRAAQIKT